MEQFKTIQGYENYYEISDFGRVKSLPRMKYYGGGYFLTKERFLKQRVHDGYLRVNLCGDLGTKMKTISVHLLVINAFIPKEDGRLFANHKDLNKLNNHAINLEWTTTSENNYHSQLMNGNKRAKYPGVTPTSTNKNIFMARVRLKGKINHLGSFATQELAYGAVLKFKAANGIINKYM